jgi:hypothetical protein
VQGERDRHEASGEAVSGIVERIEAKVDRVLALLEGHPLPPVEPPPVEPPPVEPPAGSSNVHINGMGTVQPVNLPAIILVTNTPPGAKMQIRKMPIVVAGPFKLTEDGQPVDGDGLGPDYNIRPGDHTYVLTSELPNMVVSVLVR